MVQHTLIFSFDDDISDVELQEFLTDVNSTIAATGVLRNFVATRSVRLPGDSHAPLRIATAIGQMDFDSIDDLNIAFAAPGLRELIQRWNQRFPYKTIWANHSPLTARNSLI